MTTTVLFAALAGAFALVIALLLAWPLRRVSTPQFAGVVVIVPLLALCLYRIVGTPAGLAPVERSAPQSMDAAISELEADLQRDPRQPEGWRLLGRAYAEQQLSAKSRDAYARAAALAPEDDDVQVEYAEASARANAGRRFDDEAVTLLRQVLARTPTHQRARWFLGIAQRQAGDDAAAAETWTPLLAQVDARTAASLRPQIDAARAAADLPPLPVTEETTPGQAASSLIVHVSLDPGLAAGQTFGSDASVFVIARIPDGPPMPVAVERHSLRDLPLQLTLDDADSPMPTQKLLTLKQVELVARISISGNATRQEGDLESKPVRVTLPAQAPVELVIGESR